MTNVYFLFQSHDLGRKSAVKCYEALKHSKYTCQAHYIQHDYVNKNIQTTKTIFSLMKTIVYQSSCNNMLYVRI